MSENMVKKSVDITEEDDEWLEDSYINFSKFVRRKIAERRAEGINDSIKQKLYQEITAMADKGEELKKEWKEEKQELKEEYDVEIEEQNYTHGVLSHDGSSYTIHWHPDDPFRDTPEDPPKEVQKLGEKFMESWFDKLDQFGDFVEEETSFDIVGGDEATQDFEGTGYMSEFNLYSNYLPTTVDSFTIKFESRVDLEIEDIQKSVESEF